MILNLELKKGYTNIFFPEPIHLKGEILLNKLAVKWTVYNVGIDEKILIDTTEHPVPIGYYTFDDLKEFLENLNCTVNLEKSGKCTVTPPTGKTLHFKKIGKLLGFNLNKELTKKEESPYIVNVNGGLSRLEIFCDKINSHSNFVNGIRSEKLCQFLSPGGNLFGTTATYDMGDSFKPLERAEIISMGFYVKDDSYLTDKDSYIVFLECKID